MKIVDEENGLIFDKNTNNGFNDDEKQDMIAMGQEYKNLTGKALDITRKAGGYGKIDSSVRNKGYVSHADERKKQMIQFAQSKLLAARKEAANRGRVVTQQERVAGKELQKQDAQQPQVQTPQVQTVDAAMQAKARAQSLAQANQLTSEWIRNGFQFTHKNEQLQQIQAQVLYALGQTCDNAFGQRNEANPYGFVDPTSLNQASKMLNTRITGFWKNPNGGYYVQLQNRDGTNSAPQFISQEQYDKLTTQFQPQPEPKDPKVQQAEVKAQQAAMTEDMKGMIEVLKDISTPEADKKAIRQHLLKKWGVNIDAGEDGKSKADAIVDNAINGGKKEGAANPANSNAQGGATSQEDYGQKGAQHLDKIREQKRIETVKNNRLLYEGVQWVMEQRKKNPNFQMRSLYEVTDKSGRPMYSSNDIVKITRVLQRLDKNDPKDEAWHKSFDANMQLALGEQGNTMNEVFDEHGKRMAGREKRRKEIETHNQNIDRAQTATKELDQNIERLKAKIQAAREASGKKVTDEQAQANIEAMAKGAGKDGAIQYFDAYVAKEDKEEIRAMQEELDRLEVQREKMRKYEGMEKKGTDVRSVTAGESRKAYDAALDRREERLRNKPKPKEDPKPKPKPADPKPKPKEEIPVEEMNKNYKESREKGYSMGDGRAGAMKSRSESIRKRREREELQKDIDEMDAGVEKMRKEEEVKRRTSLTTQVLNPKTGKREEVTFDLDELDLTDTEKAQLQQYWRVNPDGKDIPVNHRYRDLNNKIANKFRERQKQVDDKDKTMRGWRKEEWQKREEERQKALTSSVSEQIERNRKERFEKMKNEHRESEKSKHKKRREEEAKKKAERDRKLAEYNRLKRKHEQGKLKRYEAETMEFLADELNPGK